MHDDVLSSVTAVDMSLTDMLAAEYSLVVFTKDDTESTLSCGAIAGEIRLHQRSMAAAGLVIPLRHLEDTNFSGMAWLTPSADGGTEVTVFITTTMGRGPMGGG